jgi:hypothetical protein
MDLPPGPLYLLRLLLGNVPMTLTWYGVLRLLLHYGGVAFPTWLVIGIALPIQPVTAICWRKYRNRSEAAAHGAVLVKDVQGGSFALVQAMAKALESGYPGNFAHV